MKGRFLLSLFYFYSLVALHRSMNKPASNTNGNGSDVNNSNVDKSNGSSHVMQNYKRQAVSFVKGDGCWLYDAQGNAYLDGLSGISVTNLGHNHPAITAAITEQASTLLHTSNLFPIEWQEKLASALAAQSNLDADSPNGGSAQDRVFFANSGAEANEAAIKLARLFSKPYNIANPMVVTFSGSFHGRTMGMIAATAGDAVKSGFEPILPGFLHLPFNDSEALENAFAQHPNIIAVMLEPVQGEGGIHLAKPEFINTIEKLCKDKNRSHPALIILDEIQSGNGRCGEYFAFAQFNRDGTNINPDIVTTAKALGNGLPIGVCIAKRPIADSFVPGKHGSTFGGNPLCCRVAHTVVTEIVENKLNLRATELGNQLLTQFSDLSTKTSGIKAIRQKGLMIGIELERDCGELVAKGLEAGIVINVTSGSVIRLLPPLIMSDSEAEQLVDKTSSIIKTFLAH